MHEIILCTLSSPVVRNQTFFITKTIDKIVDKINTIPVTLENAGSFDTEISSVMVISNQN
jgi:hypothetical protein